MWIKLLRQRKLQSVMIFLIITICTTLLTASMSILTSLDEPMQNFAEQTNSATSKIWPYITDDDSVHKMGEQFEELDIVDSVEYASRYFITETILLNGKKVEVFTGLTEYNEKVFGNALYLEGDKSAADSLADDECILPASLSTEYDIHIGDKVTIQFTDGDVEYTVAAVFSDVDQTSSSNDSDILINKLPNISGSLNAYIYGKENVTGEQIEEAYREKYDGNLNGNIYSLETRIDDNLLIGHILGAIFLAVGAIMLLVSGLIIHYIIKNAMISDAKSIAVYKTLGYTSNNILFMYLKFYFAIVTAACLIGVICSTFVSSTILTSMFQNIGQLKADPPIIPGIACYLITIAFVVFIIVSIISKTKKVQPVVALNGEDYGGVKKSKKKHYKGNSRFEFSAFGIAYRTFVRDKKNAVGIIITCIVTIFSVNFGVISLDVAYTMKDNNDYWMSVDKSDVIISVTDSKWYNDTKNIVLSDERTDYCLDSNYCGNIVTMDWKKEMTMTNMQVVVFDDYSKTNLPVVEGRNPESGNEIAITSTASESLNKKIGDYLEIYLNGEKKINVLITGFFQSYRGVGKMCRLTTSAYTDNDCEFYYNSISTYLKDSDNIDNYISDMKEKIGNKGNVIKRTEQDASIMDMIAEPQQQAIPYVMALVLVIAGANIFSIVYLKNLKAQKTNGIYKCIGYTTWHLIFSNLIYVAAMGIISVLITFPISVATYALIMKLALSMFDFMEYPVQFNYLHLVLTGVGVVAIFVISTLLSSRALFKVTARDLVQE